MKKTIATKTILFLSVICLIFQLLPTDLCSIDNTQSNTKESTLFIKFRSIDVYGFFSGRLSEKVSYKNISIKSHSIIPYKTSFEDVTQICSFFYEDLFDFRRVIRQCISHYFNGSKYKTEHLSI